MLDINNASLMFPRSWFWTGFDDMYNYTGEWPWKSMTYEQWRAKIDRTNFLSDTCPVVYKVGARVLGCFGLVGNLLIILTVLYMKKSKQKFGIFYSIITAVAFLDLSFIIFFNSMSIAISASESVPAITYYSVASGFCYFSSMLSDMLGLSLTVDRLVAVAFPVFYKTEKGKMRQGWIVMIVISLLVALTRLHYAVDNYYYEDDNLRTSLWFINLYFFSDKVIPIFLFSVMTPLVLSIAFCIIRRLVLNSGRFGSGDMSNANREHLRNATRNISMLIILAFMFFLNQLGYILFEVAFYQYNARVFVVSYDSSYDFIMTHFAWAQFGTIANMLSVLFESISRALMFYLYVLINREFRGNFSKSWKVLTFSKVPTTVTPM